MLSLTSLVCVLLTISCIAIKPNLCAFLPKDCDVIVQGTDIHGRGPSPPVCAFNAVGSAQHLRVSCPRPGIVRIVGDYNVLQINCTASYPIDFNFDGIVPTEAIKVYTWRKLNESVPGLEIASFHTDITVYSIPALFHYYEDLLGNVSTSESFNYSRTGEFSFSGYFENRQYNISYYIFLEEPYAKPELIRNNKTLILQSSRNRSLLLVPCRPSHYYAAVDLQQFSLTMKEGSPGFVREEGAHLANDPTKGFLVMMEGDPRDYTCNMKYRGFVDTLVFNNLNPVVTPVPFGFLTHLEVRSGITITYDTTARKDGAVVIRTKCNIANIEGQAVLYTISGEAFREMELRKYFILPEFVNRSYTIQRGVQVDVLNKQLRTLTGTTTILGATYCGDSAGYSITHFGVAISGETFLFPFEYDWAATTRETANISIYFHLSHNRLGSTLYESQNITLSCRIITQVFSPPVVWLLEYHNGTQDRAFIDYELEREISYFTTILSPNISKVYCKASFWHKVFWRNLSMNIAVEALQKPLIDGNGTDERLLATEGSQLALNCTAHGSPPPQIEWEVKQEHEQQLPSTMMTDGNRVASVLSVHKAMEAIYVCVVRNLAGTTRKLYYIQTSSTGSATGIIVGVALSVFIGTAAASYAYYLYFWRPNHLGLTRYEIAEFLNGEKDETVKREENVYVHEYAHLCPYDKSYEIDATRFQIDKTSSLGSGAFGLVLKGLVDGMPVAVKTLSRHAEKSHLKALLAEVKIQIHLGNHPNLVKFFGASTKDLSKGSLSIFVEICPFGSLENYLRAHHDSFLPFSKEPSEGRPAIILKDLLAWTMQIANGMEYLSDKRVIHGDLAARNVLLDENRVAKITDFGLSRQMQAYADYVKKQLEPLPWRWMALESLKHLAFSAKSDVWAYGVTLWEIFALGDIPYAGQSWNLSFVSQIEDGLRLPQPRHAPAALYQDVMLHCWNERPDLRPSFTEIKHLISSTLFTESEETEETSESVKVLPTARAELRTSNYLQCS